MPPQVPRLLMVFGVLALTFFFAKARMVPDSFGETGFYRGDFPAELARQQLVHSGRAACNECHPDKPDSTAHVINGVACESCHGPAQRHVEGSDDFKPYVPSKRSDCGRCHALVAGRRESFPQQDLKVHNPGSMCTDCHVIHEVEDGGTPEAPGVNE